MEQPHTPLLNSPICVIDPQYCVPHPVDLRIVKKLVTIGGGNFVVTDSNGSIRFKVKGKRLVFFHQRRVLIDVAGNPIVTLRSKAITYHDEWQVFRGKSTDIKDMIFRVKRSSMFQRKTKLHVFMANNTREDVCDFRVEGSWFERSCSIYLGQSSKIIAQMHKKHTVQSILFGKNNFMVTVHPNIDFTFIITLIVILSEINE